MHSPIPHVLVVGGGPSGLVCALSLIRNGVSVRIIEKSTEPRLGQRGAGIMPRSLELFNNLGCADEIMKLAVPPPPTRRYELPNGTQIMEEFDISPHVDSTSSCPYPNIVLLGQNHVENILRGALAKLQCKVEVGTELVSFKQTDSSVDVHLVRHNADGSDAVGTPEDASYDWMIGADGARGVVRKLSGFSFFGETRTIENHVVGDIYVEGRTINHAELSSDENALRKCLAQNTGSQTNLKFKEIAWSEYPNGREFPEREGVLGRSFTGGQGINTGIQDAYNLGWKLCLVLRGLASPNLLRTYSQERIPVIREMLERTTQILKHRFTDNTNDTWRNGGLLQLGINYRWSSLVLDERKQAEDEEFSDFDFGDADNVPAIDAYGGSTEGILRAGDRAPDASDLLDLCLPPQQNPDTRRLFNIFGPAQHTVLIFPPALVYCPAIVKTLKKLPENLVRSVVLLGRGQSIPTYCHGVDAVFEDREGLAHDAYAITDSWALVAVRPDGVVGAIVGGPEGLQKYLSGIFCVA
ncbi:hypothetical protein DXG01_008355 [Tephrocybe rancida]|nr:hypothetical protein DXG01_008355 [Tephrocybe rancida]